MVDILYLSIYQSQGFFCISLCFFFTQLCFFPLYLGVVFHFFHVKCWTSIVWRVERNILPFILVNLILSNVFLKILCCRLFFVLKATVLNFIFSCYCSQWLSSICITMWLQVCQCALAHNFYYILLLKLQVNCKLLRAWIVSSSWLKESYREGRFVGKFEWLASIKA